MLNIQLLRSDAEFVKDRLKVKKFQRPSLGRFNIID